MFSNTITTLLVVQLIQVSIVAAIAWLAWRLVAQNRPHLAHAIWALVLLKCLTPPVFSSPTSPFSCYLNAAKATEVQQTQPNQFITALDPVTVQLPWIDPMQRPSTIPQSKREQSIRWKEHLSYVHWYVWGMGSLVGMLFIAIRYVRFVRSIRQETVIPNATAELVLQRLVTQLKIKRHVRLLIIDGRTGPAVLGLFRPTILIPASIANGKTAAQLEPLIAHELIHIRRGDLWWSWLHSIAKSLWWFHPMVWLSGCMLTREAERSCDEETVSSLGCAPSVYARVLLDVLEQKQWLRAAPPLPGVRPVDITSIRIERIMQLGQGSHQRSPKWIWLFMAVAAFCILPGAAMVVAQDPGLHPAPASLSKPASQSYSPTTDEPKNAASTGSDDEYSTRIYDVSDQLQTIMREGVDEQQASTNLLQLLPSTSVPPSVDAQQNESEILSAPLPKANSLPINPAVSDKTTRTLKNGQLIVHATGRTHDIILGALDHYREFGFHLLTIQMTVMELHHDQSLTGANMIGTSVNSDAGIQGKLILDDAASRSQVILASAKLKNTEELTIPSDSAKIDPWVRALQKKGIATILSRPKILTTSGREAAIHVGTRVPVFMNTDGHVTETLDIGFKSHILPRLLSNGKVRLDIHMENVEPRKSGITTPTTSPDGEPTRFDVPTFTKSHVDTRIETTLNTPISILGPAQQPNVATQADGHATVGKRLMVLMTCQATSPFNQPSAQQPKQQHAVP